jgi:hypothetical protein
MRTTDTSPEASSLTKSRAPWNGAKDVGTGGDTEAETDGANVGAAATLEGGTGDDADDLAASGESRRHPASESAKIKAARSSRRIGSRGYRALRSASLVP